MNRKYIIAIAIAAMVLVVNQIFIQYFLNEKKYDAKTINWSGRQRMLSQKINLEFYKATANKSIHVTLPKLVEEWEKVHYGLLYNSEALRLSSIQNPKAKALMEKLSLRIDFIKGQIKLLQSGDAIDLPKINTNQSDFLVEMNQVVGLLEESSDRKLQLIIYVEIILMIFSLLILILEVKFIFKPIHQKLLSALKETQESKKELEKSLVELEQKNKDLEQFAYVASHDLQEPLRTITSFTQLLHRRYKEQFDRECKEEINFIIDATQRMKSLIVGLLAYTKIGRKKEVKTVDCNGLLQTVQQDLSLLFKEKNALIKVEEFPKLKLYETEARQLFQNLITNALKFQKPDTQPNIVITGVDLQDQYQFSIKDNGIGIAEEYQDKIFSIFKRLHRLDEFDGTGIGLAQCKKIVEMHNGKIWVDSAENQGSTFHFTISYSLS